MAAEREVNIPGPNGESKKGIEIPMTETRDKWSEIELEDGTVLIVKQIVTSVVRVKDVWDHEGNPLYLIKSTPIVSIKKIPNHLKKGGGLK